jgi:hypothetical protein
MFPGLVTRHPTLDTFMNILTRATVLVLNRNWRAINVRAPQEAPVSAFIRNQHGVTDWRLFAEE